MFFVFKDKHRKITFRTLWVVHYEKDITFSLYFWTLWVVHYIPGLFGSSILVYIFL